MLTILGLFMCFAGFMCLHARNSAGALFIFVGVLLLLV